MTVTRKAEIDALRRHLDRLADEHDETLTSRYSMHWPRMPPGGYWKLRWIVALFLRCLEWMRVWRPDPWPAALKQGSAPSKARPLLIWAIGVDRDVLRDACNGLSGLQEAMAGFAPVLITDVADFAFFSRLGWLVEYLPPLAGQGEAYEERKLRFIARLYRGAPLLPVQAGLDPDGISDLRYALATAE